MMEIVEENKEKPTDNENSVEKPIDDDDPYAYLKRQDFSAENFKIEIKNLPKIYGINEFRKLLNKKLNLNSTKIKAPKRNSSYAFVCFRTEEDRDKALKVISEYKWKGKQLNAVKAKPSPDPLVKKRKEENENEPNKRIKLDKESQEEKLKFSIIPLWNIPYEEQLKMKQNDIETVLKKLGNDLIHHNKELKKWIEEQKLINNGLPCKLNEIRFSEQINEYRNKCAFTIGINEENNLPTIGFRIGSYVNGTTGVGSVDNLCHIPEAMKRAVKLFEKFVRDSKMDVFNFELHTGYFRQLLIRCGTNNELMLVIGIHPQKLTNEELNQFKKDLIQYFSEGPGKEAAVTSLYYQKIVKRNAGEDSEGAEHLWGDTHITEKLLELQFKISPEAFFQVNTKGAEILYKTIIEMAGNVENTTVLDVCCGTGTIGLCFAKHCKKVLGLEIVPQAIIDAKANAKLNNIENSEFVEAKAEEFIAQLCNRAEGDVVAIVDPPRAGLHQKGVQKLRNTEKIQKLIYVSCNPMAALKNFVDLGRPQSKTLHNDPFVPVEAVAVDLFPYTKHCELIIRFERLKNLK